MPSNYVARSGLNSSLRSYRVLAPYPLTLSRGEAFTRSLLVGLKLLKMKRNKDSLSEVLFPWPKVDIMSWHVSVSAFDCLQLGPDQTEVQTDRAVVAAETNVRVLLVELFRSVQ